MERPNPDNAHIRKGRRDAPDTQAEDAARLLSDPAFQRAYERVRSGLIREIEEFKADGGREGEEYLLEVCRALRMLQCVRYAIGTTEQRQRLRLADYKASVQGGSE